LASILRAPDSQRWISYCGGIRLEKRYLTESDAFQEDVREQELLYRSAESGVFGLLSILSVSLLRLGDL
jgi:hypothetical protein